MRHFLGDKSYFCITLFGQIFLDPIAFQDIFGPAIFMFEQSLCRRHRIRSSIVAFSNKSFFLLKLFIAFEATLLPPLINHNQTLEPV